MAHELAHLRALSALFAGLVGVFGKIGMRDLDSTLATAARTIVMAGALVALVTVRGQLSSWERSLARPGSGFA